MAWTLCDKEDVTSLQPINIEKLEDRWSDFAEAMVLQHIGNPYIGSPTTISDEYHNGDGTDILRVRKPPIVSVTSLSINDATILPDNYVVFTNHIQLKYQTFKQGRLNVKITYDSGKGTVDQTMRFAVAMMIVAIHNYQARMGADATFKFAKEPDRSEGGPTNINMGLLNHLKAIMRSLVRRDKVRFR